MGPLLLVLASAALPVDIRTATDSAPGSPTAREPSQAALPPSALGVLVNLEDPLSIAVADYYRRRRAIPATNVIGVHLRRDITVSPSEFFPLEADLRCGHPPRCRRMP